MLITLEQRHEILTWLNLSQLESDVWQQYADRYFYAEIGPSKQAQVPQFEEEDIFARIDKLEAQSSFKAKQCLKVLQKLNELEDAIDQEMGSANHAIKQADVLIYEQGQRVAGMEERREVYMDRLRYFLDLPIVPKGAASGTLGRS